MRIRNGVLLAGALLTGGMVVFALFSVARPPPLRRYEPDPERFLLDLSPGSLTERLRSLVPHVEEVLGEPFPGPVFVHHVRSGEIRRMYRREAELAVARGEQDSESMEAYLRAIDEHISLYGMLDPHSGDVLIVPESWEPLVGVDPGGDEALAQVLDVVLAHEAVHVYQHSRKDFRGWIMAGTPEEGLCRRAIVEGHAGYVARAVGQRLGYPDFFGAPRLEEARVVEAGPAAGIILQNEFTYARGQRFYEAVSRTRGRRAFEGLLEAPPDRAWMISHPDIYLDPSARVPDFDDLARSVRECLDPEAVDTAVIPFNELQIRALLVQRQGEVGGELQTVALSALLGGAVGTLSGRNELEGRFSASLILMHASSALLADWLQDWRLGCLRAAGEVRGVESTEDPVSWGGVKGVVLRRDSDVLLARSGRFVLEFACQGSEESADSLRDLAERIFAAALLPTPPVSNSLARTGGWRPTGPRSDR